MGIAPRPPSPFIAHADNVRQSRWSPRMPADKIEVLMLGPMPSPLVESEIDRHFVLHRLWQVPDREALIAELAPGLRAIAAGGGAHSPIGSEFLARFPKLEIVSSFGVGYDHIDAAWAGRHGIVVTNTPDVLTEEVADTTMGLLLSTVRQLPQAERYVRAGKWLEANFPLTATLRDRTVGIVGLGHIGKAVARRLDAFGVPVVYYGRHPQPAVPYRYYPDLVEMARAADVLIAMTPGGPATRYLISTEVLDALGPNGILINVSRGSVVDQPALIAALKAGRILTAGLDVYPDEPRVAPELLAMDHVVLLPHVGSASAYTRNLMGRLVVRNLVDWAAGKAPPTPVPETPWPPKR
jgi:lactate dehydrogenase-like 2-hydroxyacid dehydrogenase